MNIVFAHAAAAVQTAREVIGAECAETAFFGFQWEAIDAARRNDLNEISIDGLISPEEAEKLDDLAMARADDWYRDAEGKDFTLFRGVSIGRAYSILMYPFLFFPVYRYQHLIQAVFDEENPPMVWCDRACPGFFRELLSGHPDIISGRRRLNWIGNETASDPAAEMLGPSLSWRLKGGGRKGAVQRFLLRHSFHWLSSLARAASGPGERPALLVSYHHTMKDLYAALFSDAWRNKFSVFMLERPPKEYFLQSLFRGARMIRPDVSGDVPDVDQPLGDADGAAVGSILARWKEVRIEPRYLAKFEFQDRPLFPVLQKSLDEFIDEKIRRCARWIVFMEACMEREKVKAVVTAIDSMPRQSVVLQLARKRGVPSVNPIHGIPLTYRTLDFRNAEHWAVGGKAVARALASAGRPADKILADSACIFDRYGKAPAAPADFQPGDPPRILLLTSPRNFERSVCPFDEAENYIFQVLDALSSMGRLPQTIKLHPAESLDYYRALLGAKYPGIALIHSENFDSVARRHDVVIGPGSTALVQSVLLKKRVLCAALTRYRFPVPFAPECGIPVAYSPEELKEALSRLLSEPAEETRRRAAVAVEAAVGTADGNGTQRLLSRVHAWVAA